MPKFYVCTTVISFSLGVIITLISLKKIGVNMLVALIVVILLLLLIVNEKTGILERWIRKVF